MEAGRIERAAYIAAHAILAANLNSRELVCPGAKRSYAVDTIAGIIKGAFGVEGTDQIPRQTRNHTPAAGRTAKSQKILHMPADTALQLTP
jgi:hypothetical protein